MAKLLICIKNLVVDRIIQVQNFDEKIKNWALFLPS
jgi:hypothetical protein